MTAGHHATDRAVLRISGPDAREFLQGLVTNDVRKLADGPIYAALLSPQGKYLFDFFLVADGEDILLDVKADRAAALAQRLGLYKLRAKVTIAPTELAVVVGTGPAPEGALADPRHPDLGWRAWPADPAALLAGIAPLAPADLDALRVDLGGARERHRAQAGRLLHPRDGLRAPERRRLPQGLLRGPGGDGPHEAQDRAPQGPRPRPPRRRGPRRRRPDPASTAGRSARSSPPQATAASPTCASTAPTES